MLEVLKQQQQQKMIVIHLQIQNTISYKGMFHQTHLCFWIVILQPLCLPYFGFEPSVY